MKLEVGTLKELNVKPGDVVEMVYNGILKKPCSEMHTVNQKGKLDHRGDKEGHKFRLAKMPVQAVTTRKVIPGTYGNLSINDYLGIHVGWTYGVDEIKNLIEMLQEIVSVLEEDK